MSSTKCLVLILVAVGLSGGTSPAGNVEGAGEGLDIRLTATRRNAGEMARATLMPRGDETSISLFVSGVPSGVTRPVHLYTYIYPGTCANPGESPAYELNQTVNTYRHFRGDAWRLSKAAPVALATLRAGDYAIVLRTSPADGNVDIFCGDIR